MDGDVFDRQQPCEVCGMTKTIIREGYYYCVECGTRAADSQQVLQVDESVFWGKQTAKRKIVVPSDKLGSLWSSWHGYNIILHGLVEELAACCSKPAKLKTSALRLWGMFLRRNRIAFYSKDSDPKMPMLKDGIFRRDLEYLYDIKAPAKKKAKITIKDNSDWREKRRTRASLITKHFKSQSQQSQQTHIASQNLAQLKYDESEKPKGPVFSLKTIKTFNHAKKCASSRGDHLDTGYCGGECKGLFKRRNQYLPERRKFLVSIFNLYVILALALKINDDEVEVGDFLRWCREGHISLNDFKHFFPEDIAFKKHDPKYSLTSLDMLSHYKIRKVAGELSKYLDLGRMATPDIRSLIKRYLKELELPSELLNRILQMVNICRLPKYHDLNSSSILPNFEAQALAYIIVTLKLIFGLDGTTENQISFQTEKINRILSYEKSKKSVRQSDPFADRNSSECKTFFVWKSWVNYVEYRKICIGELDYPTMMQVNPWDNSKPELFLHFQQSTKRDTETEYVPNDARYTAIKHVIGGIPNNDHTNESYPLFPCSLYPRLSNIEIFLLSNASQSDEFDRTILEEDFTAYRVSHLFNPRELSTKLKRMKTTLHIYPHREKPIRIKNVTEIDAKINVEKISMQSKCQVKAKNCREIVWDEISLGDKIMNILVEDFEKLAEQPMDVTHLRPARSKCFSKENFESDTMKNFVFLNTVHTDYWVRHYANYNKFTNSCFEVEFENNFPNSFVWLVRECASMVEMTSCELYGEVMELERRLINMEATRKKEEVLLF